MELNKAGINLIKSYEKCRLEAYTATEEEAERGIWTIGYGMTFYPDGSKVQEGETITKEQAEEMFSELVNSHFAEPLKRLITNQETNDNQFSALVSTAYNCGVKGLAGSTTHLLQLHNAGEYDKVYEIYPTCKTNGGMKGLINRRNAERELYAS